MILHTNLTKVAAILVEGLTQEQYSGGIKPNPTTPHRCQCGIRLNWESSSYMGMTRWIATCPSPRCGEVHAASDADTTLKSFLLPGREPRPYAPPWVRLFLEASR